MAGRGDCLIPWVTIDPSGKVCKKEKRELSGNKLYNLRAMCIDTIAEKREKQIVLHNRLSGDWHAVSLVGYVFRGKHHSRQALVECWVETRRAYYS